jgi:hypothetical protein
MSRPPPSQLRLQLEELGARKRHTYPVRSEVDQHVGLARDLKHTSEAVFIVRHQISRLVSLSGGFLDDGDIKRTSGQVPLLGA